MILFTRRLRKLLRIFRGIKLYQVNWKYKPILFIIDIIGYVIFFPYRIFKSKINENEIKKILVIRIDEIGDVLLTTPVFRALRRRFPKAEINVLIKKETKELLENNPNVDSLLICEQPWLKKPINLFYYFSLIKQLRKEKFDLAIELHPDARNIFLGFISARCVIGHTFRGLGVLLDKVTKSNPNNEHIIQLNLDVARLVRANASDELEVYYSKENAQNAKKLVRKLGKKIVCINPGTGRESKLWLNERWARLADVLIEKYNVQVIFTGSKEEEGLIKDIQLQMRNKKQTINLAGKTSLLDLAALLKKCRLLIASDSGTLHIAKALEVPLIGLYGAVNPMIWGYNDKNARSVCKAKEFKENKGRAMMELIQIEDVLKEVNELWER